MKTVSKIEVEILEIAKALQKIEGLRPTAEFNLLAGRLAELSTLKTSHKTASKILINIEKKCPGIVRFLQSVAGAGHRYLEFETIEMATRAQIGTSEGDIFKRINQLFYRYDYGWADPRSKMITTLLKCILGQEIDSTFRFFVCSQS